MFLPHFNENIIAPTIIHNLSLLNIVRDNVTT